MHLVVVGVNHKTAPVEIREMLSVDGAKLSGMLSELKSTSRIRELCVLSTCNRTEVYAATKHKSDDDIIAALLSSVSGVSPEELREYTYIKCGHHAVEHLFAVACGLDSMALGETQILGQIKDAFCAAADMCCTGKILNNLFQRAIAVGKRARTETGISNGGFSIGAAAADLARFVLGDLKGRRVMLLGSGKMSKAAAAHLVCHGVGSICVVGRTPEKIEKIAEELCAEPVHIDELFQKLPEMDVVISSTSNPEYVITRSNMEKAIKSRRCAPIILIDIAVPRDVDPDVSSINGVFLYDIDDLEFVVKRHEDNRRTEVEKVAEIIDEETAGFMDHLRTLEAVPIINRLRDKFNSVYHREWEKCSVKLAHLSEEDRECVRKALKSAVTKLTHDPILRIKEYASNGGSEKNAVVCEIFGLEPEKPTEK